MRIPTNIPKTAPLALQWITKLWFIFMLIFILLRVATLILFMPAETTVIEILPSFWLGFLYDARWISIILLPIALLSIFPRFSPFYSTANKKIWSLYLGTAALFILFFFGADFGNFSYNHTRLNASALNFAEDPKISFQMLWQSYPMIWILLALVVTVILLSRLFRHTHVVTMRKHLFENLDRRRRWFAVALLFLGWCIYGLFSLQPLKWKDAFQLENNFTAYLSLNPLQNFFSTLQFRKPTFNNEKAQDYYPLIANFLGIKEDNSRDLSYDRLVNPNSRALESRPNVVLVLCESFSFYKSSMSDNPLNTTPYFKKLCDSGIFFNRCFTPTFGTARGAFAVISGIPDVQLSKFSTRNPQAIDQRTIINSFDGYEKFYFLGGNSDFNNFDGLIKNIDGVHIYQEGEYKSPSLNVWGISDKNLFLEAGKVLTEQQKPFFAFIQTADNHRPFTIPKEDVDFKRRIVPEDTLHKYGFESLKEFQSFCYTDYCFKKFMEYARKQRWFDNTIFVFIGDHGVEGETAFIYPKDLRNLGLLTDEHVPLLFYAPELFEPALHHEVVSQIDVLPTIAGMIHEPYLNTTLGRDLINSKNKMNAAFIIHHDEGNIGVVNDHFYFTKNLQITKEELFPIDSTGFAATPAAKDSIKQKLSEYTTAIYETARYMLIHNKKRATDTVHK